MASNNSEIIIPQEMWLKKSTITFFKRNQATVMAPQVIHLCSSDVIRTMASTFEVVSRDCHYITIAARTILADRVSRKIYQEEEVFKAEQEIARQFERVNDYFDKMIAQAGEKIRLSGNDPAAIPSNLQAYGARCSTRASKDYLDVIKKADMYLTLIDYLWIMGELSDTQTESLNARLSNQRAARSQILSIPKKTTAQFQLINRICKGAMEQRQQERRAQSERDKQRAQEEKQRVASNQVELDHVATGVPANQEAAA
ncbi:MAG: hypothetical protein KJZ92_15795 [Rhodocyclaceae bacterium]|nr:hypothetical protein [Rhodocyclaceae bacterium]